MTDETPSNEVVLEAPVVETTVEAPEEKFDGLSKRDALAESIKIHREGKDIAEVKAPTNTEVKQAVEAEPEPPAEFSAAGKAAWKSKDIMGIQKEFRRIHDSRTTEITRAQAAERKAREEIEKEKASVKPARDMAERVRNYLSVRGEENLPDEVKIAQALQLIEEMRKGDGKAVKAELLKMGIDLDKPGAQATTTSDPKIEALQATVEELKRDKEEQKFHKLAQTFDTIFVKLTSQKTRTGESVFPDLLDNSEKGIEFARELGSLTQDETFQKGVLRRIPDATFETVVQEAYKYLGGKVSGEPVKVSTQSTQQHIQRSRRATAANPGRSTPINRSEIDSLKNKLGKRAALTKAWEIHREH